MLMGFALFLIKSEDRTRRIYVMIVSCITAVLSIASIFTMQGEPPLTLIRLGENLTLSFQIDGLGCIFGTMVSILWPLATLYANEYMSPEHGKDRFFAFYMAAFGVTLGIAFSANIMTMYLFYELLTLSTLPLVMHELNNKARYAGKVYLIYSMSGAALGFIAMVFLIQFGGPTFRFGGSIVRPEGMDTNMLLLVYLLGFFGFGVKAAVLPGHKWLLRASVAPTPVTALLHAVAVVKAGVFAVMRITWYGFGPELLNGTWAQNVAMGAAILTIVYASARALRTKHLKRRLAWSTVSNLSYILLGVTIMTPTALVAALVHMVAHAFFKITLFFDVGAVHYKMHRDYVPEIEGCGRLMPVVFGTFIVASLGIMGVPPMAGFTSKWMLATSAVESGTVLGCCGAVALIISAILTALYLTQIIMLAFFPRKNRTLPETFPRSGRFDPNYRMTVPLIGISAIAVCLGLAANGAVELIEQLVIG
ncbi:MAG: proton-conducting transporter membrane subunit [Eubacteriales bacterium]|nr:proton-conducting transporter membrane subunit [Eubacteriales bacterium]